MITISGATNSAYDGTFVVTGLYNTTAGLNNDIGAATEFTFAIAGGTDTASGTITATLDDQFNFAYEPVTGSATVSAELMSLTNADNGSGTPQAGVMFRASTNPDDPFFAIVQTSAGEFRPGISHNHRRQRHDANARRNPRWFGIRRDRPQRQ